MATLTRTIKQPLATSRGYFQFAGASDYLSTVDKAALDITGDIDIIVLLRADHWAPNVENGHLVNKFTANSSSNTRSYVLSHESGGALRFNWSTTGNDNVTGDSTVTIKSVGIDDFEDAWLRVTLDVNNTASGYDLEFWYSQDAITTAVGSVVWTQLGTTIVGGAITSIFASTTDMFLGKYSDQTTADFRGRMYGAWVYDGIPTTPGDPPSGTLAADPDFRDNTQGDWTAMPETDAVGNSWAVTGTVDYVFESAVVDGQSYFSFDGTGDYLETADKAQLDITGDFEIIWLGRITDTTNWQGLLAKGDVNTAGDEYGLFRSDTVAGTTKLSLAWRNSGDTKVTQFSDASIVNTADRWYRATLDVDNGSAQHVVTFFYSDDPIDTSVELVSWTQHSVHTNSGTTSVQTGVSTMRIGQNEDLDELTGRCYGAWVYDNSLGGVRVANADFRTRDQGDWSSSPQSDDDGNSWAVTGATWTDSGTDYSTITAAEADAPSLGTDIWKMEIADNNEYNENVTLSAGGTPSITSYLWLTAAAANRHAGVAGTGHARIRGTTAAAHVLTLSSNFTQIEGLEIQQDSAGSSDEAVRFDADECLLSHSVLWTDTDTANQDGIFCNSSGTREFYIDNCIVYGFRRAQLMALQSAAAVTNNVFLDHVTLMHQSPSAQTEAGAIYISSTGASANCTIEMFNVIGYMELDTDEAYADGNATPRGVPDGTVVWNGTNNLAGDQTITDDIDGTDNTTGGQLATDGDSETTQSSGSFVVFNDITVGTENFTLLDSAAGNLAAGNGTDRQGSEPDARQDFSIDILGKKRSVIKVDIGAHQFSQDASALLRRRQLTTVRM